MALRFAFAAAGLSVGFYLAAQFLEMLRGAVGFAPQGLTVTAVLVAGAMFCGLAGFLLGPLAVYKSAQCARWLETRLFRTPGPDILAGAAGLILGLVVAFLAGPALSRIPWVGNYLPLLVSVLLGYLGWVVAVNKREDLWSLVRKGRERAPDADVPQAVPSPVKVIDTSAIIDGRIADLCRTGFLEGQLVVPAFVLDELRHIADSSDALKRNRGRRGLDILNRIQKELGIPVKIYDRDVSSSVEVDMKLVELARALNGKIVTNDFNLNKVAGLHGVEVLNVNDLANAMKPAVLPGEEMTVYVIRDGKEAGQGVAYLDDGTMVVVEGGRRYIGQTIGVEVTSVLQTAAGRMIFARPKAQPDTVRQSASGG